MKDAEAELREDDWALLARVAAKDPDEYLMGYGETSATFRLTDAGLVTWRQGSPFVAVVRLTDAGREAVKS